MGLSIAAEGEARLIEAAVEIVSAVPGVSSVRWFTHGTSWACACHHDEWVRETARSPLEAFLQLLQALEGRVGGEA
ncbi:MAG: hypothetical protein WCK73_12975 [Deltaproteobacteria bacterium]